MTRRLISALLAAALLPFAAAPAVASSPDRSQPAPRSAAQVRILDTTSPFSPNGDGNHDRVAVRYRLTDAARVTIEVTHRGKTVLRTASRATRAGTRSFTWDGTRASGRSAADGRYRVVVRATTHGATRTDATAVVVRTSPTRLEAGTLELSSDTVYPYAKIVHDVVVGNFGLTSNPETKDLWGDVGSARAQILDRAGRIVSVEPVSSAPSRALGMDDPASCGQCGRFTWDGRDSDGVRQAPGSYRVRVVQGRDSAGNTRILSPTRTVTISRKQLEAHTTYLDFTAADAPRTEVPYTGCNGCTIAGCAPKPSARFPGGLSYACSGSFAFFTVPVPGRRTPYDRFSVEATGGPSTPGASALAVLYAGLFSSTSRTMTGDTTATAVVGMTPNSEVYPTDWPNAVIWSVDSQGTSYDIASFKVQLFTYVPVA